MSKRGFLLVLQFFLYIMQLCQEIKKEKCIGKYLFCLSPILEVSKYNPKRFPSKGTINIVM